TDASDAHVGTRRNGARAERGSPEGAKAGAASASDEPDASKSRGTVRDDTGAPVGDALVTITAPAPAAEQRVRTDAEGRFAFQYVPAGRVTVGCAPGQPATNLDTAFVPVERAVDFDGRSLDLVVSRGNVVRGTVVGPDGRGVSADVEALLLTPSPKLVGVF